jgi:hypothetical protein
MALIAVLVTAVVALSRASAHPPLVLRLSGVRSAVSRPFAVPGPWQIDTVFSCRHPGTPGNFSVWVVDVNGLPNVTDTDRAPNVWGVDGTADTFEPVGGTLTLEVYADCPWSLQVMG